MTTLAADMELLDYEPPPANLLAEVVAGLRGAPRTLPCKFFYDKRGSELFDRICELPEYYPTRTEIAVMREYLGEMCDKLGPRVQLIELGSGSSLKTAALLDQLEQPAGYVPIDISRDHLLESAARLREAYPHLEIRPICADYNQTFEIPAARRKPKGPGGDGASAKKRTDARRVLYFPGSTIGNFHPDDARAFLHRLKPLVGVRGAMLIGVDLRKHPDILVPAYDDDQEVTAAFDLNLLHRINREAGADFKVDQFEHHARWNPEQSRMEMHLVSRAEQAVHLNGNVFHFRPGESIRTECSYKYDPAGFATLAAEAGWSVDAIWTDPAELFSVQYLTM